MIKIHFLSCWQWPDSHNILRVEGTKTRAPSPVLVGENQCDCGGRLASHPQVTNADAFQPGHAAFRSPSEQYGHACARSCHQSAPCNSRPCGSSGSCSSPTRRRLSVARHCFQSFTSKERPLSVCSQTCSVWADSGSQAARSGAEASLERDSCEEPFGPPEHGGSWPVSWRLPLRPACASSFQLSEVQLVACTGRGLSSASSASTSASVQASCCLPGCFLCHVISHLPAWTCQFSQPWWASFISPDLLSLGDVGLAVKGAEGVSAGVPGLTAPHLLLAAEPEFVFALKPEATLQLVVTMWQRCVCASWACASQDISQDVCAGRVRAWAFHGTCASLLEATRES